MENNLRNLLYKHGFSFKKAYGQNFLTDVSLLEDIVLKSGITKETTVLEIGCGAGALTKVLADNAKNVIGFEIDERLKPVLSETLSNKTNVELIFKDVLKEDLTLLEEKLGKDYVMVANLPYYITTPIVMRFIENAKNIKAMVIMVQEEVALRFASKPSTADYGAITVAIDLRGKAEIIKRVDRNMFVPVPNVDSAVVKIEIDREKFKDADFVAVRDVVRAGFSSRRKMLVNNLMNFYKFDRAKAEEILNGAGVPLNVRGENLSAKDYVLIAEEIKKNND